MLDHGGTLPLQFILVGRRVPIRVDCHWRRARLEDDAVVAGALGGSPVGSAKTSLKEASISSRRDPLAIAAQIPGALGVDTCFQQKSRPWRVKDMVRSAKSHTIGPKVAIH